MKGGAEMGYGVGVCFWVAVSFLLSFWLVISLCFRS